MGLHSPLFEKLVSGDELEEAEYETLFKDMLSGQLTDAEIGGWLAALRCAGETAVMLAAGAKVMQGEAAAFDGDGLVRPILDNCGTGGDGSHSFNISTASAIVAAACGQGLAKHGNRSVSSKCGSADLLFEAGYPQTLTPDQAVALFRKTGFTFFFAPAFHPGMKHVMPARKALGVRTVFNLLGPLANPIRPDYQLIGVGDAKYLDPMAGALRKGGVRSGLVVHSRDGLDEISPAAVTEARFFQKGGLIGELQINPDEFGCAAPKEVLRGGDSKDNLKILFDLLEGNTKGPFPAIALNAGACLWIGGKAKSLQEGTQVAQDALQKGRALDFFKRWIAQAKLIAAGRKV